MIWNLDIKQFADFVADIVEQERAKQMECAGEPVNLAGDQPMPAKKKAQAEPSKLRVDATIEGIAIDVAQEIVKPSYLTEPGATAKDTGVGFFDVMSDKPVLVIPCVTERYALELANKFWILIENAVLKGILRYAELQAIKCDRVPPLQLEAGTLVNNDDSARSATGQVQVSAPKCSTGG